ncbi:alcohol dehydrogenase catalytic domain-containing protein [Legionella sp.]|uniref:alcohol dehydrogenase catalytic domain-containing protein n=1 Tax=Legionella sp. TaxID=459 RepID=UPI00322058EF
MKALVFHHIGDIRLQEVKDPTIENNTDAIVKITTSAICGTDLHFVRGTVGPMNPGTILGHEAVGTVAEIGKEVTNLTIGDRVIIPSTIACGTCEMCHNALFSQCNHANPNGQFSGTAFYGGPKASGPFHGCQAEYVRVPFAQHNLVKIEESISDDQAILLSDIFPTAYFGVDIASVKPGNIVVVLGCGPVGQFVIASCLLRGVAKIIAIDGIPSRLEMAKKQGAEIINFTKENPYKLIMELTKGLFADVVIDAVGIDSYYPTEGPLTRINKHKTAFQQEVAELVPVPNNEGKNWLPGNAPSFALRECVDLVAKCGTISIIGVYAEDFMVFPIGKAMNKNVKIVMGNCPHRAYIPFLLQQVQSKVINPAKILTQKMPLIDVVNAYKQFDLRQEGWIKVGLKPN